MDGMGWPQDAAPSAHLDTFARDSLPPREAWPVLRFDLPELLAERGLAHMQEPRGVPEVELLGDGHDGAQVVEIHPITVRHRRREKK